MWQYAVAWAVSFVISALFAPSPSANEPDPARLRDLRLPTTDAQRPIPVTFGRVLVRDPNLVWYGDFRAEEIEESVSTGPFSSTDVVVGYSYYLGYHYAICHSPDSAPANLLEFRVEDRPIRLKPFGAESDVLRWRANLLDFGFFGGIGDGSSDQPTDTTLSGPGRYITWEPGLWGGYKEGGGVWGAISFLDGDSGQLAPAYLVDQLGTPQPAYRGVVSFVAEQLNIGESAVLRPHQFLIERYPDPAGTGQYVQVQGDANPAWVLLEAIVDRDWGLGYALARADIGSFTAAAEQLAAENHGFSHEWQRQGEVEQFIGLVLQQIDASLYDDPVTGLWTLTLIRDDYVFGDLPVLDQSNVLDVKEYNRPTLGELPSEVTVIWVERDQGLQERVTVHNLGVSAAQGGQTVARTIEHPGIGRAELANTVAERELSALSRPLARAELTIHSDVGMALRPGDPVRWRWPDYGVEDLVLRIVQIDYGELTRAVVRVSCVEDAFREGSGIYAPPPPTQWQPVAPAPAPVTEWLADPTAYWELQAAADAPPLAADQTALTVLAVKPTANSRSYALQVDEGTRWATVAEEASFVVAATLDEDILPGQMDVPASLELASLARLRDRQMVWVDGELCRLDAYDVDNGRLMLGRGCADTVSVPHAAGTRIYLPRATARPRTDALPAGDDASVRAVTLATTGQLDTAEAPTITVQDVPARHVLPYPPGRLRVNGNAYPDYLVGELALSWAHRDRVDQGGELVDESVGSRGPEPGVTYTLRLYGETDGLLRTETGLTGTSYTYADEAADSGLPNGRRNNLVRLELEAERDALTSWTRHHVTARRVGYGYSYGYSYGGL